MYIYIQRVIDKDH